VFFGSLDRVFHNLAEPASPPCSRRPRITNGILSSVISASSRYDQKHWRLGGAQSGVAGLSAEDIDWQGKVVSFLRRETATGLIPRFCEEFETVLRTLRRAGELCLKDPQPSPPTERAERRRRAKRTRLWSNPSPFLRPSTSWPYCASRAGRDTSRQGSSKPAAWRSQ